MLRITSRNAQFQQWEALLGNRNKRQRAREFLVQGVRPITIAAEQGWPLRTLIFDASRPLSGWARELLRTVRAEQVAMSPELLAELGEKGETAPEVIAVMEIPDDDLARIAVRPRFLGIVFDRPASPGNIGSVIRSADAFGAGGGGTAADRGGTALTWRCTLRPAGVSRPRGALSWYAGYGCGSQADRGRCFRAGRRAAGPGAGRAAADTRG